MIKTSGVCRNLQVQFKQSTFKEDFHVFALDGEGVILGMKWLEGVGDIKTNFKELTRKIKIGG